MPMALGLVETPSMSELFHRVPDPLRAHGAWVYLGLSVLAGLVLALPHHPVSSLAVGGIAVAGFILAGALARKRHKQRRLLISGILLLASTLLLFSRPIEPRVLAYAVPATLLLLVTAMLARRKGFFAPSTLACGVMLLALAAPACARAGGAPRVPSLLLLALLAPMFAWRCFHVRTGMLRGKISPKIGLRRVGMREAAVGLAWTTLSLAALHAWT
ncbi:MAG: hypothetical protein CSA62_13240 [Planctomycetota bacterium]|nr:MAG: hypothetical protein CSA62_13240 [Planctomycetota bacterium]